MCAVNQKLENSLDFSTLENLIASRNNKVDDEYIGDLKYNNICKKWKFTLRNDYDCIFYSSESLENEENILSVILESPHKDEFGIKNLKDNLGNKVTSRPLNNVNSKNALIKFFNEKQVFNNILEENKVYRIVLVNAIQYQCSLGESLKNKDIRNKNWILNWIDCKGDFITRIKKINSKFIINLCTEGSWIDDAKEWHNIDEKFLNSFNLGFTRRGNSFFKVKKNNYCDCFTLQDVVEFELENNKLINNNYCKFYHPAAINFDNKKLNNDLKKINDNSIILEIYEK